MAHEIERKFLLLNDEWRKIKPASVARITQGYVPSEGVAVTILFPAPDTAHIAFDKAGRQMMLTATGPQIAADFRKVSELPQYDARNGRLHIEDGLVCRLRARLGDAGAEAFLTIKAPTGRADITNEFEIPVDPHKAEAIMRDMTEFTVSKTRHVLPFGGQSWEVDVFSGPLSGLVMAELEVKDTAAFAHMTPLPGLGADVTENRAYANRALGEFGIPRP